MADSKTSDLTALGAAPATGDLFVVVDVSDTSQGAGGTTKRLTFSNIVSGVEDQITELTGLTTPLSVAQGGSGAATLTGILKGNGTAAFTAVTAPSGTIVGTSDVQTLTNKTLTTPLIASFYQDSIGGSNLITVPAATDTLVGKATTDTLTNKRVTKRVSTEASSATPTINTDNVDAHSITAQGEAITSMSTNLSGTPTNFQTLIIRILDDGTGRAITWGAAFEARGVDLPTTTTAGKLLTVGFIFDSVDSIWGAVASVEET